MRMAAEIRWYLRGVDVRREMINLLAGQQFIDEDRRRSRSANGAVAYKLHAAVVADAYIIRWDFDRETRRCVVTRSKIPMRNSNSSC